MDAVVKISNAVSDWLFPLRHFFIEFGSISVSRSPLSCVCTRTGLTPLDEILAARHISVFRTHCPAWQWCSWAHGAAQAHRFVGWSSSWSRLKTTPWYTPRSIDRRHSTGLEQPTSGSPEACHPPWPCCSSDPTAPADYATLMMMMMMMTTTTTMI